MKDLHIDYHTDIENCGECWHDVQDQFTDSICERTGTRIKNHWDGVLPDCPLEDKDVKD